MMISPEYYCEEHLRGKSQQEILKLIRSLKREISRLKKELEDDIRSFRRLSIRAND